MLCAAGTRNCSRAITPVWCCVRKVVGGWRYFNETDSVLKSRYGNSPN